MKDKLLAILFSPHFAVILMIICTIGFVQLALADDEAVVQQPEAGLRYEPVKELRPTQDSVGMLEVDNKTQQIENMKDSDLNDFLRANPVPVVVGPGGKLYVTDHHHLARAVLEAGHKHVYVTVIGDLSHLDKISFWKEMMKRGWVYLLDKNGKKITPDQLPKKIKDMVDAPFRSLAGFVRDAGGYTKSARPFAEFKWADFFEARLKFKNTRKGLNKILPEALDLAHSQEASHLDGYLSEAAACSAMFTVAP